MYNIWSRFFRLGNAIIKSNKKNWRSLYIECGDATIRDSVINHWCFDTNRKLLRDLLFNRLKLHK